ncbi:Plasmodium exported protein (PHISTc), unknown function [Plasmodium sp. gorilla clade G2]|uniref:Plasmodium exported protein (PHISTc), unknown function n=1 Tax=Plasmodium sp. gorilla clade G2 TaxID=880535 RepID=UPI000D204735|nr:Plasmodium exported protein (PHISTc), unknown function [Plasmodium sp. gorilla clade G2]SOV16420.1 Plasmodium exported protein (PHISTc), unknown function [Plasmodium sp. gorilla clade G2]
MNDENVRRKVCRTLQHVGGCNIYIRRIYRSLITLKPRGFIIAIIYIIYINVLCISEEKNIWKFALHRKYSKILCEWYTTNRVYFRSKNDISNYSGNNNNIYVYKDLHIGNFEDVDDFEDEDDFDYEVIVEDDDDYEDEINFANENILNIYYNSKKKDKIDGKNKFYAEDNFERESDFHKYDTSEGSKIKVENEDNNINEVNNFKLFSEYKKVCDNNGNIKKEEVILDFDKYYKNNRLHISNDKDLMEYIKNNYGKMTIDDIYVIYFYVHENERKKYMNMECQLCVFCEQLANKYNIEYDYMLKTWQKAYNDVHGFFLNKEKGFYKKIRKIKDGKSHNLLLSINSLKEKWKEFRDIMNNIWRENFSDKFRSHSKKYLKKKYDINTKGS